MKYFTAKLYQRLQDFSSDEVMDAADAAWEKAVDRYDRNLERIEQRLPRGMRQLMKYYLHDAEVVSLAEDDMDFVIVLRLDPPPRELLVLTYRLLKKAKIMRREASTNAEADGALWVCDEIGLPARGKPGCTHTIMLSNGWEVSLHLRDVKACRAVPIFPTAGRTMLPRTA